MTNPHQTNSVEEVLESIINKLDDGYRNPTFGMVNFLREKLTTLVEQARGEGYEAGINEAIKLSDRIEGQTDTTMGEWRGFKGFRNTLRDILSARTISSDNKNV